MRGGSPYFAIVLGHSDNPISVCIVCRNEADELESCLASAAWADEVIVLDLQSTDGSSEVARKHGVRVIPHAAVPIVEVVRNVVADTASGEWILALDPDERFSPGLAAELKCVSKLGDCDAVVVPRMNIDFGYAPTSPLQRYEPQLRMYRRRVVRWPTLPNALPHVSPDRVVRLPERDDLVLLHERYRSIPDSLERFIRYAPAQARAMIESGEQFTARRMLRTLGQKLYRHLVMARALRDGVPGLIRAGVLVAFHFYVWAAFWHQSGARRTPADDRLLRRVDLALVAWSRFTRVVLSPLFVARKLLARRRHSQR